MRVAVLLTVPSFAVSVTAVCEVTFAWETLKVAEVLPAAIVTVAGTVAAPELELARAIESPPVGAGPEIETVPVTAVVELPFTELGETASDESEAGCTFTDACCELDPKVAVTLADVADATADVVAVNIPVFKPVVTVTLAGTETAVALEVSLTTTTPLPDPGDAFKVTVPFDFVPPTTVDGEKLIEATWNGLRVRVAPRLTPP